jgi:hypothetical protein
VVLAEAALQTFLEVIHLAGLGPQEGPLQLQPFGHPAHALALVQVEFRLPELVRHSVGARREQMDFKIVIPNRQAQLQMSERVRRSLLFVGALSCAEMVVGPADDSQPTNKRQHGNGDHDSNSGPVPPEMPEASKRGAKKMKPGHQRASTLLRQLKGFFVRA